MESENLLLGSQGFSTFPYPDPDKSSLHPDSTYLRYTLQYYHPHNA
jgi:hypothetical protein